MRHNALQRGPRRNGINVPEWRFVQPLKSGAHAIQSTAQLRVIVLDITKNVLQLHSLDAATGGIQRRRLKHSKVAEFFANRQPSLMAIEACGGVNHWASTLIGMRHKVKLPPAKHLRAFVLRYKTAA